MEIVGGPSMNHTFNKVPTNFGFGKETLTYTQKMFEYTMKFYL